MAENAAWKHFFDDAGERLFKGFTHRPGIIYAKASPRMRDNHKRNFQGSSNSGTDSRYALFMSGK